MYEQSLVKIIEPIKKTTISRLNKSKKWKYGYNKEHDVVVISKLVKLAKLLKYKTCELLYRCNQKKCTCMPKTNGKK